MQQGTPIAGADLGTGRVTDSLSLPRFSALDPRAQSPANRPKETLWLPTVRVGADGGLAWGSRKAGALIKVKLYLPYYELIQSPPVSRSPNIGSALQPAWVSSSLLTA